MQETQIAESYVLVVLIKEAGVKVLRTRVFPLFCRVATGTSCDRSFPSPPDLVVDKQSGTRFSPNSVLPLSLPKLEQADSKCPEMSLVH
jgi:hypothetical protein